MERPDGKFEVRKNVTSFKHWSNGPRATSLSKDIEGRSGPFDPVPPNSPKSVKINVASVKPVMTRNYKWRVDEHGPDGQVLRTRFATLSELCERYGVHRVTVHRAIARENLPPLRGTKHLTFHRDVVPRFREIEVEASSSLLV